MASPHFKAPILGRLFFLHACSKYILLKGHDVGDDGLLEFSASFIASVYCFCGFVPARASIGLLLFERCLSGEGP